MSTIQDTDLFEVQRGTASYQKSAVDLMSTILDTDYMLIQRGIESFKVTCEDVKDQLGGGGTTAPVLDSVVLSQDGSPDANRFTSKSFTSTTTNSGGDATTLEMTGTVTGALGIKAGSDPITTNAYPGTSSTDVVLTLEGETNLGDVIQVGDTVTANVSYTPETDTISDVTSFSSNTSFSGNAGFYTGNSTSTDPRDDFTTQTAAEKNTLNTSGTLLTAMGGSSAVISFNPPLPGPVTVSYRVVGNIQLDDGVTFTDGNGASDPGGDRANTSYTKTLADGLSSISLRTSKTPDSSSYNLKYINYIESNGSRLIFNDAGTTLTLPTEKDIALFQADDVVQVQGTGNPSWNESQIWSANANTTTDWQASGPQGIPNLFDGSTTTLCYSNVNNAYCLWNPITASTSIRVFYRGPANSWFVVCDGTEVAVPEAGNNPGDEAWFTVPATFPCQVSGVKNTNEGGAFAVEVDGKILVNATTEIKVTATDVSAKTITVDGGSWDASNQSQVWSNLLSAPGGVNNASNAFNGEIGADAGCKVTGETLTFNAAGTGLSGSVKVLFNTGNAGDYTITATGTGGTQTDTQNLGAFVAAAETPTWDVGTLQTITLSNTAGAPNGLAAIYVDNKLLVDAVNDSQVWSSLWQETAGGASINNPEQGFDGDLATVGSGSSTTTIDLSDYGFANKTVEWYNNNGGPQGANLNDEADPTGSGSSAIGWYTLGTVPADGRCEITLNGHGTSSYIAALRIDSQFLIDKGIRNLGDSKVSTISAKQGSGTVSDITGAQVTVTPFTDNCFKEGQWLTVNKTIDVDPKTDKITSYDDTTKVITVDGDTDLMQFAAGDSVFMTDNSGSGASTKTGYKLTTTDIQSVSSDQTSPAGQIVAGPSGSQLQGTVDIKDAIAATSITAVRGFALYSSGDLSAALFSFNLDGSNILTSLTGVSEVGEAFAPIGTYTSYVQSDAANADNDGFYSFTFDAVSIAGATTLNVSLQDYNDNTRTIQLMDQNGQWWTLINESRTPPPQVNFTLTFPGAASTNPDLNYFKPGDVVKRPYSSYGNGETNGAYPQTKLFDGNVATNADCCLANNTNSFIWEYTEGIPFTTLEITGVGKGQIVKINDLEVQNTGDFNTWQTGAECVKITPTFTGNVGNRLTKIELPKWQDGAALAGIYIDGTLLVDSSSSDVKVVSVDTTNNKMTVDGGTWAQGDKVEYQTTGGVGTIAAGGVNIANKTITLTASESGDARWIADNKAGTEFRVATATKPAVSSTAYLTFSADGAVTGYQATPVEPRAMDNKTNPTLTFPATFSDTGQAPDTEFPDANAYIQTSIQLKNDTGDSAVVASNALVPTTTGGYVIAACQCENNADELKAMSKQVATHDQRVADHTAAERQSRIDDFEAALERYSHDHD